MLFDLKKDATPESITMSDIVSICSSLLVGAVGVGFVEGQVDNIIRFSAEDKEAPIPADDPDEVVARCEAFGNIVTGDVVSACDSEALIALCDSGIASVKTWAKDCNRFYNNDKLGDCVLDAFAGAFNLGRQTKSMQEALVTFAHEFNATL